ncbi:MAG: phospholipase D family protein [Cyclobacteriaceae bacterium]|nr:phospholipase D family protein [Cyclobacteriaceae bacterium]
MKLKLLLILSLITASCSKEKKKDILENKGEFCSSIHRNDSISLSKLLEPFADKMEDSTGVFVLEDGGGSMVARAWLSEYAEKSIDIQYFIFSPDNVGLIACDYLVRAADRGVKVRIIVDDIMVDAGVHEILTLDSHDNIEIKVYNPGTNLGKNIISKIKKFATDFRGANQRMHNKTFTVDEKIVITGGRNIADEYFDYDHEYNFRDRDVLLLGKIADNVQSSFDEFWNHPLSVPVAWLVDEEKSDSVVANKFERLHQYACNPENFWPQVRERIKNLPLTFEKIQKSGSFVWLDSIEYVSDAPGKNDGSDGIGGGGASTEALVKLIQEAKSTLDIQSPYLITTEKSRNLFSEAVKRGVKVRILTNSLSSTDNIEAFSGYRRDREELLKTGVRIFEFKPDAAERFKVMTGALQMKMNFTPIFGLHAKSIVIDGKITVIGTFNLDPRSANLNTECVTIIHSRKITEGVLKGMDEEFKPANSWETTLTYNPDSKAGTAKNIGTMSRRVIPKGIL